MRVAKYISDLLYEYECVVIPGLGGFISNDVPAGINANQHSFNPPSKKIVFNPHLQINDGLLINHIAESEKISYSDARLRLEQFVLKCKYALNKGKRINFFQIGHLYKNIDDKIEYEPDTNRNYYADSFGLSSFISPPVKRDSSLRLDKKPIDRKPQARKKEEPIATGIKTEKKVRYVSINLFSILFIAILGAAFIFGYSNIKSFYQQNATSIPFFYSTPNEYLITNFGNISLFEQGQTGKTQNELRIDQEVEYPEETKTDYRVLTDVVENTDEPEEEIIEENSSDNVEEAEPDIDPEIVDPDMQLTRFKESKPETKVIQEVPVRSNINLQQSNNNRLLRFFIIAGSFQDRENAQKLVNRLRQKGYDSLIVGQNKYGMYRVCFEGFATEAKAEDQLAIIRREENPNAWIFVK